MQNNHLIEPAGQPPYNQTMTLFTEYLQPKQKEESALEITDLSLDDVLEYFGLATHMAARAEQRASYEDQRLKLAPTGFAETLTLLVDTLPPSTYRDTILEDLVQAHFTTWDDLDAAEAVLSKNCLQPDELQKKISKMNSKLGFIPLIFSAFFNPKDPSQGVQQQFSSLLYSFGITIEIDDATSFLTELQRSGGAVDSLAHLSDEELLAALQDLLVGKNGFLQDRSFEKYGQSLITYVFSAIEQSGTDKTFAQYKEVLTETTYLAMQGLSVERRSAILLGILRSFQQHAGSQLLWQHMVVDVLMQFVSGTKLLQMDVFIPEEFKLLALSAKENMPPTSKFFVRDALKASDRLGEYTGIGPSRAAASTATVHPLQKVEDAPGEYSAVSKTIHEHAEAHLDEEFAAFRGALTYLAQELGLQLNVEGILQELQQLVRVELDPFVESANTKVLRKLRSRHTADWVQVPEIIFRSDKHIEMSMAPGYSLQSLLEGDVPEQYKQVNWKQVCFLIVRDYFQQVFEFGMFNADEHAGNVFVRLKASLKKLIKSSSADESPPVTVIDHGAVGFAGSQERKKVFFLFGLGFELQDESMVSEALFNILTNSEFKSAEAVKQRLRELPGTLFENAVELLVLSGKGADLILFAKGLAALFPLIEKLSLFDKMRIAMPYIRKLGLEPTLIRNTGSLTRSVLSQVLTGIREKKQSSLDKNKSKT